MTQQTTHLTGMMQSVGAMTLAPLPLSPLVAGTHPIFPYPQPRMNRAANRQLPPQTERNTVLNEILDVDGVLKVYYDIRQPASSAFCLRGQVAHYLGHWLHEMAAMPGLESLTIRAPFMAGYPLVVFPRGPSHVVSVEDVLEQVHRAALDHLNGRRAEEGLGLEARTDGHGVTHNGISPPSSLASMSGWMWRGLVPSREERDVWILLLQ